MTTTASPRTDSITEHVPATSAFDPLHPPDPTLVADCVHCGFCLPTCPTYVLWGRETDSPRGRIVLIKGGLEGDTPITNQFARHFDTCLGCMACVTACPSGVQYDKLLEATRPQIERQTSRSLADRLFRGLIFALFPYPRRLRMLAAELWAYQRLGLQWIVRHSGVLHLLPTRLRAMERVLPPVSLRGAWTNPTVHLPAQGEPRRRVGLLLGCVQRVFFDEVNQATMRVLTAEGCDVVVPRAQGCCGALMLHAGREHDACAMARKFIDVFEAEAADVDTIVINAAGCGSTVKEYGHLLRDDPVYRDRAQAIADKCRDISEILAELEPRAPRHPIPLRIAYHDACHLQHAQGVNREPRQVLATIPELELCEIPEAGICCGSAGIYNLVEPEAAAALGDRKAGHIQTTRANAVVSSNPGCLLQIAGRLEQSQTPLPTYHMVELVDASIRGTTLSG
ncbi:MAG: heterodisulfide reductase-related iron-sulfur binding cluster [Acidobacteriota bacterium]|nr:heterodisulfide reductase-related iron-sulfur binding cluster [Acidobacteriota bacterium]